MSEFEQLPQEANTCEKKLFDRRTFFNIASSVAVSATALAAIASFDGLSGVAAAAGNADTAQGGDAWWTRAEKDVLDVIHQRRSYRNFKGEAVAAADLEEILSAGMSAPSTHNLQPWEFLVVESKDGLATLSRIVPKSSFLTSAGAVIVPCLDTSKEESLEALLFSMACCNMNMLLAAHALGYGAVWIEIMPNTEKIEETKKALQLPEHILPICYMPIGKPTVQLRPEKRFATVKIHRNTW